MGSPQREEMADKLDDVALTVSVILDKKNTCRFVGWDTVASFGITVFPAPPAFSSCSLF